MTTASASSLAPYLPEGLPAPDTRDALLAPYYEALSQGRLAVQRCSNCGQWQFGPEWICHRCHSFSLAWVDVAPCGQIYSWERVWHPVHPCLKQKGPYLAVLVELPHAGGVRLLGNLLGDPLTEVRIGEDVDGVFEHHQEAAGPFTLLHWKFVRSGK